MSHTFWLNNPSVLLDKKYITELWPSEAESTETKLNAYTRIIILLAVVGFMLTRSVKVLISAAITLVIIVLLYKTRKHADAKKAMNTKIVKEGFTNRKLYEKSKQAFTNPTRKNPLMNVLLPEIKYNPHRKAAAPSFNPVVEEKINEKTGNVGPDPRLFLDLGDSINFEQSMQRFYTTANSRVANDQTAFAKFCYGNMPSCKDGDGLQCVKDNHRWINY
jgi:hypothetical protein